VIVYSLREFEEEIRERRLFIEQAEKVSKIGHCYFDT
jgi:hypothetical protein